MSDDAPSPDAPPSPVARAWSRVRAWPEWVTTPLWLFLFSRVGIFAVTGWSLVIDPRLHRPGGRLAYPAIEGLCRWDCGWFHRIAMDGYAQPHYSNFFPLFPLLGRGVHELTGLPIPIALVVVANLLGLAGLMFVFRIFELLEGPKLARAGTVLLVAWPFSFFHAAGYPESFMLASSAVAIWFAHKGRHLSAGVALGVGILARHLTVVAGLSLLVAQLKERGFHPRRFILHRHFLGLLLPFAIAGLYFGYLALKFDDPLMFWRARSAGWGGAAWYGVVTFFQGGPWEPQIGIYLLLSLVPAFGAWMLTRRREWWILAGFGVGLMITLWAIGLMGLGRYTQACWPAFLPLAVLLDRWPAVRQAVVIAFAVMQGMFLYLFTHSYPIN